MVGLSDDKTHDRRGFLVNNMKALARLFAQSVGEAIEKASGGKRYLRPPGAIDESAFLLSCTRCGECARVCPVGAIKFLPATAGAAVGTPFIDPQERACELCGKCMPVCEPKSLLPVADPRQVRMGKAVLNPDACWAYQGQICDLCSQRCPFPGEAIRMAQGKPEILANACTGCGLCVYACVSAPVSISIIPAN